MLVALPGLATGEGLPGALRSGYRPRKCGSPGKALKDMLLPEKRGTTLGYSGQLVSNPDNSLPRSGRSKVLAVWGISSLPQDFCILSTFHLFLGAVSKERGPSWVGPKLPGQGFNT